MKIAYIASENQEKYNVGTALNEELALLTFLQNKGLDIESVVWNDPTINWQDYQIIILKSPWDYHEKTNEFLLWLENVNKLNIRILNDFETVKWNINKKYLHEIEVSGLKIIPTQFFEQNSQIRSNVFEHFDTEKIIVKPCISASAKDTMVVEKENFERLKSLLNENLKKQDFMVQPFVEEIRNGEWSLVFFDGKYSHAVLKVPKENDFRVQHFHGGKIEDIQPDENLILESQKYVDKFAENTLYARVDGILINGDFHLMELELIEPYLYLENNNDRFNNFYQAFSKIVKNLANAYNKNISSK